MTTLSKISVHTSEYHRIIEDYKALTGHREFIGGMPVTLEIDCLRSLLRVNKDGNFEYSMTLKVDGVRYLLFLTSLGELIFIDRSMNLWILLHKEKGLPLLTDIQPFLLDGELIEHRDNTYEFLLFDGLYYSGRKLISSPFTERQLAMSHVSELFKDLLKATKISWFALDTKPFFPMTLIGDPNNLPIYKYIQKETNKGRSKKLKADGIILQPTTTSYVTLGPWKKSGNIQFKWKPLIDQTVDLKIHSVEQLTPKQYKLTLAQKSGAVFTLPGSGLPATSIVSGNDIPPQDSVGEFSFIKKNIDAHDDLKGNDRFKLFKFVRGRGDKSANSYYAVSSVYKFLQMPFTLDNLHGGIVGLMTNNVQEALQSLLESELVKCAINYSGNLIFSKSEIIKVGDAVSLYHSRDNIEFEFRLGRFISSGSKKQFSPNIQLDQFHSLFEQLSALYSSKQSANMDLLDGNSRSVYAIGSEGPSLHPYYNDTKTKLNTFTSNMGNLYGGTEFRMSLAEEIPSDIVVSRQTAKFTRIKKRWSFAVGDWQIDLSELREGRFWNNLPDKTKLEIEAEYTGPKRGLTVASCNNIVRLILSGTTMC